MTTEKAECRTFNSKMAEVQCPPMTRDTYADGVAQNLNLK